MKNDSESQTLVLRDYQTRQNDAITDSARRGHRRIISAMATGSGKSAQIADLTLRCLNKNPRNSVLIVLPRRSLVLQLSQSFHEWGINNGVIMSGIRPFYMPRVQIASIDTYLARVNNGRMEHLDASLLIIDEMHLQFTPKKLEIFARYPMVVGYSATPIAPRGQSLGIFWQDIIETITFSELIEQGWLTPLRYFAAPDIDLSGIDTDADGDWRESQLGDAMDKPELVGDIYKNWQRIACGKSTVIFASSQAHARHLCDEFNSHGWRFEYVDCTFSDDDRQAIFSRLRRGDSIGVVNVGIVSTGIDIPNLECCVLARPTKLISIYLQCVGRVTRLFKGKTHGIIIDHAGIIERIGLPTDDFEWSLDGRESVEERARKAKEERKEPKEITCRECGYVFKSSRICPSCGYQSIKKGEPVPVHEADLQEIVVTKPKPAEKASFYAQLLHYSRTKGYSDGWADHVFREKFGSWPHKKRGVIPEQPGSEVMGFIRHVQIKRAKGRVAA